jgi:dTDP-6-deoxy-L-talose 4-dehydrogenase (NAD+)
MRIAVTGARGFVGRHVVSALRKRGVSVTEVLRPQSIGERDTGANVVAIDFANPPRDLKLALLEPDVVVHLAWARLDDYRSLEHLEFELPLHFGFLKAVATSGVRHLLVTGTCLEYGLISGPLDEDGPTFPVTAYGFAKDALRRQLQFLQGALPFGLTWARLFYLYGEGQRPTSLVPSLEAAVAAGKARFEISGARVVRDYLPVDAAAEALASLALAQRDLGPVNVCSGRGTPLREFVERFIDDQGWTIEVTTGDRVQPPYEPQSFWGVRRKLDQVLTQVAAR